MPNTLESALIILYENSIAIGFLKAFLIIFFAIFLNVLIKFYFRKLSYFSVNQKSSQDRRVLGTRLKILRRIISSLIYIIAFIMILFLIPGFKTLSVSLLAGAGIIAVIIGFAAQKTIGNIISGISIAVYSPFRIGDKVNILQENGQVEDINLRHTVIRTWDNKRIIIPNSIISEREIINYSLKDEKMLFALELGISYDSDVDKAKEILVNLANKHEENLIFNERDEDGKLEKKEPYVRLVSFGDSSVNLKLYFWVKDNSKGFKMKHELLEQIKKEFDKKGISIPFPHRTIVYKTDLEKQKGKR